MSSHLCKRHGQRSWLYVRAAGGKVCVREGHYSILVRLETEHVYPDYFTQNETGQLVATIDKVTLRNLRLELIEAANDEPGVFLALDTPLEEVLPYIIPVVRRQVKVTEDRLDLETKVEDLEQELAELRRTLGGLSGKPVA
jgi:hypothetical protein